MYTWLEPKFSQSAALKIEYLPHNEPKTLIVGLQKFWLLEVG